MSDKNQCDGCRAGIPVERGFHDMGKGGYRDPMWCQKDRYLDERRCNCRFQQTGLVGHKKGCPFASEAP